MVLVPTCQTVIWKYSNGQFVTCRLPTIGFMRVWYTNQNILLARSLELHGISARQQKPHLITMRQSVVTGKFLMMTLGHMDRINIQWFVLLKREMSDNIWKKNKLNYNHLNYNQGVDLDSLNVIYKWYVSFLNMLIPINGLILQLYYYIFFCSWSSILNMATAFEYLPKWFNFELYRENERLHAYVRF